MSDTTFTDGQTVIVGNWLNDINKAVYRAIGVGGVAPQTPAQVLANIGGLGGSSTIIVTNHTLIASDLGGMLTFNGTSLTITIPANTTFPAKGGVLIENLNSSSLTISFSGCTGDGGSTLVVPQNQGALLLADAGSGNWYTFRGFGQPGPAGAAGGSAAFPSSPGPALTANGGTMISTSGGFVWSDFTGVTTFSVPAAATLQPTYAANAVTMVGGTSSPAGAFMQATLPGGTLGTTFDIYLSINLVTYATSGGQTPGIISGGSGAWRLLWASGNSFQFVDQAGSFFPSAWTATGYAAGSPGLFLLRMIAGSPSVVHLFFYTGGTWNDLGARTLVSNNVSGDGNMFLHSNDNVGNNCLGTITYYAMPTFARNLNAGDTTTITTWLGAPSVPAPFWGSLAGFSTSQPGINIRGGLYRAAQPGGVINSSTNDQSTALQTLLTAQKGVEFDSEMMVLGAHINMRWYQKITAHRTFFGPASTYVAGYDDYVFRYASSDSDPYPNLQVYQSSELDGLVISGQLLSTIIDGTTTGQYPTAQMAGIVSSVNGIGTHAAHNYKDLTAVFLTHGFHLDAEQYTSHTNMKAGSCNIGILNTSTPQGAACVDYVINNPIVFSNDLGIAYFNLDTFGEFGPFQHIKQKDGKSNAANTAHIAIINGNWRRFETLTDVEIDDFGTEFLGPNTWYSTGKNFPIKIKDPLGPLTNALADGTGSVSIQVGTGGLYFFGSTGFSTPYQTILANPSIVQTLVIDPFTASAEVVTLTAVVDANHITITRGSPHFAHSANALIIPSWMMNGVNADGQPWVINGANGPYLNFYTPPCEFYVEGSTATWRQGEPADATPIPGQWRAGPQGIWRIYDANGGGSYDQRFAQADDPTAQFEFYNSNRLTSGWGNNITQWWEKWTQYGNNNPFAHILASGWGPEQEIGRNTTTSTAYKYALSSLSPAQQDTSDEATATRGPWAPSILGNNQTITNNTIIPETVGQFAGRKVRRITVPAAVNPTAGTTNAAITNATLYQINLSVTTTGGASIAASTFILIDSESMFVVSGSVGVNSTGTLTLARGMQGTALATHLNGATVKNTSGGLGSTTNYNTGGSSLISFSTNLLYGYTHTGPTNGTVYGAGNAFYAISSDVWLTWTGASTIWLGWGIWLDLNAVWWPGGSTSFQSPLFQWMKPNVATRFRFQRPANFQLTDFAYGFYTAPSFAGGDFHVSGLQCLITDNTLLSAHDEIVRHGYWVRNQDS